MVRAVHGDEAALAGQRNFVLRAVDTHVLAFAVHVAADPDTFDGEFIGLRDAQGSDRGREDKGQKTRHRGILGRYRNAEESKPAEARQTVELKALLGRLKAPAVG
ncbi:hypothetical protein GCM10008965_19120 [Methylorubrum aminovorans]|nr:hypothetical protein GCM10025880_51800 [Methylorubrum aminovorans]